MAYLVSRRRREIGLRMALGASRPEIAREVFGRAGRLVVAGGASGSATALAGARLLESFLYGVQPHDPVVTAAAPLMLAAIALAACILPAHRAASVDPMAALREE
jgi:ABC-type antimicrobial peptide transport system permease subunit